MVQFVKRNPGDLVSVMLFSVAAYGIWWAVPVLPRMTVSSGWPAGFSADNRVLAVRDNQQGPTFWDIESGRELSEPAREETAGTLAGLQKPFSPDGRFCVNFDPEARERLAVWDVARNDVLDGINPSLTGWDNWERSLAFSHDSRAMIYSEMPESGNVGRIIALDLETGKERFVLDSDHNVFELSPNDEILAAAAYANRGDQSQYVIGLRDMPTGQLRATLAGHVTGIVAVTFSSDGRTLASMTRSFRSPLYGYSAINELKLWNVQSQEELSSFPVRGFSGSRSPQLRFSPDGKLLIASSHEMLIVWNISTSSPYELTRSSGQSQQVSPDGRILAKLSTEAEQCIEFVRLPTLRRQAAFPIDTSPDSIVFSPDSRLALALDGADVQIIDVLTGSSQGSVPGGSHAVFSTDSTMLAILSGGPTRVYDLPARKSTWMIVVGWLVLLVLSASRWRQSRRQSRPSSMSEAT